MINIKFWEPKEEFLLLELLPGKTKGLLLEVDKDKNIRPLKLWNSFELKKLASAFGKFKKRPLSEVKPKNLESFVPRGSGKWKEFLPRQKIIIV